MCVFVNIEAALGWRLWMTILGEIWG